MSNAKSHFVRVHSDAKLPKYADKSAAAMDVFLLETTEINPQEIVYARTGLVGVPPMGYHFELVLRSSTPKKYPGIIQANCIGIIDENYCGPKDEIKIPLLNYKTETTIRIPKGRKIAQLILRENLHSMIKEITIDDLKNRESRGGLGSTGEE